MRGKEWRGELDRKEKPRRSGAKGFQRVTNGAGVPRAHNISVNCVTRMSVKPKRGRRLHWRAGGGHPAVSVPR